MKSQSDILISAPLGQASVYSEHYDPALLFPISRMPQRQPLGIYDDTALPFIGHDEWQAFEISWLNPSGKPNVRIGRFTLPATSPNLIESKSWKLYLNSYNQTVFSTEADVITHMTHDLSDAAGAPVQVVLFDPEAPAFTGCSPEGECIDALDVKIEHYLPTPSLLAHADSGASLVEETLYSHLLKSNCPVTGQPDWGTVIIHYRGQCIDRRALLAYLISFRQHQDFHEHCVERIFVDIMARLAPTSLVVSARYVRRGGLDINPTRATSACDLAALPAFSRLLRQ